jgi:hypothetical protein
MPLDDSNAHDKIARIEIDLEKLAGTLDRCRKAMLLAKVTIVAGALWMLAASIGIVRFDSAAALGGIVAVIGGIVVYGTNSSTSKQTREAMKAAERNRSDLIDMINPRAVTRSEG